jgi:hypothetical protein
LAKLIISFFLLLEGTHNLSRDGRAQQTDRTTPFPAAQLALSFFGGNFVNDSAENKLENEGQSGTKMQNKKEHAGRGLALVARSPSSTNM